MNVYKVVGPRRVAHVAPGGEVREDEIAAAGGSVAHLIASGHIAPAGSQSAAKIEEAAEQPPQVAPEPTAPVAKARKAASTSIPVDEADTEETK